MSETDLALSGSAFAFSLVVGLGGMSLAHALGHRFGMVSHPRLFGRGATAVSHLGGAALAVTVLVVIMPLLFFADGLMREAGGLLGGAFVLLFLGLMDDRIKDGGLSPYGRLMVEAGVAVAVAWAGVRATPTGNEWIDGCLTVFFPQTSSIPICGRRWRGAAPSEAAGSPARPISPFGASSSAALLRGLAFESLPDRLADKAGAARHPSDHHAVPVLGNTGGPLG